MNRRLWLRWIVLGVAPLGETSAPATTLVCVVAAGVTLTGADASTDPESMRPSFSKPPLSA